MKVSHQELLVWVEEQLEVIFKDEANPVQELMGEVVAKLMNHFDYVEFPIRGFNMEKQLGYLVGALHRETLKAIDG